jgi:hypothetical protein
MPASGGSSLEDNSASSSSVAHSPLFKLPRELRDYIYEYSFCSLYVTLPDGIRGIEVTKRAGIPEPALLLTSKILREEAATLFYGHRRLVISINSYDPAVMLLWKQKRRRLAQAYGPAFSPSVYCYRHTGLRKWDNLKMALRLHLADRVHGLQAAAPSSHRYNAERFFISGLFKAVRRMTGHS